MNRVKRVLERGRARSRIGEMEGCHQGRSLSLMRATMCMAEGSKEAQGGS